MIFQKAAPADFARIRDFYWRLIDAMEQSTIGWKKGIYPTDEFLRESLSRGELYTLSDGETLCGCVILNSECNEGYAGVPWTRELAPDEVLIPHALAVDPAMHGRGCGKALVREMLNLARSEGKKAVRLDILSGNDAAERLYTRAGFQFVQAKPMFYEDTGWTEYKMFELNL